MNKDRWKQIIREARLESDLCEALAEFLASNNVTIEIHDAGTRGGRYDVRFDRPHFVEVERGESKHWAVKA